MGFECVYLAIQAISFLVYFTVYVLQLAIPSW